MAVENEPGRPRVIVGMAHRGKALLLAAVVAASVLVAVTWDEGAGPTEKDFFETLAARHEMADRVGGVYSSLPEAMPQVRYIVDGREVSVADAYVVGEFVDVEPGRSHRWTFENDTERRHETEFNAPEAQASTVHLTLRVERSIVDPDQPAAAKRAFAAGSTVRLGVALGARIDVEAVRERLSGLTLAALLYDSSAVFDYDRSLWAVLEDGGFLGVVEATTVTFPALDTAFGVDQLERPGGPPIRGVRF